VKHLAVSAAWPLWMAVLVTQGVLSLLLYNPGGNPALRILGWAVGLAGCPG
jgi:hypothetical protein